MSDLMERYSNLPRSADAPECSTAIYRGSGQKSFKSADNVWASDNLLIAGVRNGADGNMGREWIVRQVNVGNGIVHVALVDGRIVAKLVPCDGAFAHCHEPRLHGGDGCLEEYSAQVPASGSSRRPQRMLAGLHAALMPYAKGYMDPWYDAAGSCSRSAPGPLPRSHPGQMGQQHACKTAAVLAVDSCLRRAMPPFQA